MLFGAAQSPSLFPLNFSSKRKRDPKRSPIESKVTRVSRKKIRLNLPSSSASVPFSLPKPPTEAFEIGGQVRQLGKKKVTVPAGPAPRSIISYIFKEEEKKKQIELNSYIHPSIIEEENLILLHTDEPEGQYKQPYLIPSKPNKLALIFTKNERNSSAESIRGYLESSIKQYNQIKAIPAFRDKCVTIDNATRVLEQKCLIVDLIPDSFEKVLVALIKKGLKPFESMQQLNGPLDDNQRIALDLLSQIKDIYDLSIEHGIDTDLHKGNFRVKIDAENKHTVILTDFRESIEKGNLMSNKRKEFHEFQRDLGSIFKPEFLDEYFEASLKRLNEKQNLTSEEDFSEDESDLFGISDLHKSTFN